MSSIWSSTHRDPGDAPNAVVTAARRSPGDSAEVPARPGSTSSWRSDARFLWGRLRRARRPDLYLARLLGRPLSDRLYLQLGHFLYFGSWPDLGRPRTLNEHIIAYMLRCRDPILRIAADKLRARRYIAARVGPHYLVPLYGTWLHVEDIALEALPRPCVLKPSAASGKVVFLRHGEAIDLLQVRAELRRWLRCDYSRFNREWSYHGVRQQIIAEQMLTESDGTTPPDFKLWVVGGKVRMIQVDRGRFAHHTRNLYLPNWEAAPARLTLENHAPDPRPERLAEMIEVAERLAAPFEFLRIDCYLVNGELYVGELTNSPGAGFEKFIPASFALVLGQHWKCGEPGERSRAVHARRRGIDNVE